jgi:hypothetical protein
VSKSAFTPKRTRRTTPWESGRNSPMPIREIARLLGVSWRTVFNDYQSAIRKLQQSPEAFALLLPWVQASAEQRTEILRAGSLECDKTFVQLYGERVSRR